MSFTIAVSGKGGTGKTTLAGLIIGALLREQKTPILAVDADANANLNEVLGIGYQHTIGRVREKLRTEVPPGLTKDVWFELKAQECLVERDGYDLLVMGRPEGPGCYCVANTLARQYIDILTKNYRYVVIDNEAGMEHFSRLTTQNVDLLFILSDASIRGLQTARRILDLIQELKLAITRSAVLINQARDGTEPVLEAEAGRLQIPLAGFIPFDENIFQLDRQGKPTYNLGADSPAAQEVKRILANFNAK